MDDAAKRIADAEARVARQEQIVAEMERDRHPRAAERARAVLGTMRQSLRAMREAASLRGVVKPPAA